VCVFLIKKERWKRREKRKKEVKCGS